MRHRLFYHVVWTTRDRAPLLDGDRAGLLVRLIEASAREERVRPLALGLVSTHVHLLLAAHPLCSLPRLLQRWKGGMTFVADRDRVSPHLPPLRWARGYSVQSVSPSALPAVLAYVRDQHLHHPAEAIPGFEPRIARVGMPEARAR